MNKAATEVLAEQVSQAVMGSRRKRM